ncbi:MAG TPA: sensor domain-containing diguanylate cyclase [Longimicrobium sp.]|nr:sensor domain-containing diguanylate cyclase [Longimicrobium sp.]
MRLGRHGGEHRQRLRRRGRGVAHQPAAGLLNIPRSAGSSDRHPKLGPPYAAAAGAYLIALTLLGVFPSWGIGIAILLLGGLAAWTYTVRRDKADLAAASWPALHLLLWATGSLASPLIALAAAWVVAIGRLRPKAAPVAAAVAALLPVLAEWLHAALPPLSSILRYELLIGLAAAYALVRRAKTADRTDRLAKPTAAAPAAVGSAGDAEVWARALELARRATDAHEAALWRADAEWQRAMLVARAASPGVPLAEPVVALEGTPYRWAIEEGLPQLVQPGRRELPVAWAAEMMIVPVDLPEGVLALAYSGVVPPGAEAAALEAGQHLSSLAALLRIRGDVAREDARVMAIADAAQRLPGEIEVDAFARQLAASLRQGTGAMGVAVAMGMDESGGGRILHVDDTGAAPVFAEAFGEGESRMALALKAGIDLSWDDLRRERDRLPLCTAGEGWRLPPRSAAIFPLMADGRALGAVAAWHPEPGRFGEKEMELLRLICNLAPMPLRSARAYEAMDQRAHTDALTGLPNRAAFEEKMVQMANVFDRYARPFGVLVLDVDFFKKFNDTHGHDAGDRVLQHVAKLIAASVRDVDLPARLGGEEFVVLLPETGVRAAAEVGERVRRAIESRPVMWHGRPLSVTLSVGAAACPDNTTVPAEVLKLADEALYRAKSGGRNRVALAPRVAGASIAHDS